MILVLAGSFQQMTFHILTLLSIGGINLYAYCGSNPIMRWDPSGCSWESFWDGVGNFFANAGKVIGGGLLALAGAADITDSIIRPWWRLLNTVWISTMMYGGFVVGSVFDSQIQSDMQAIDWTPFNSDVSKLTGTSGGRKVSFYKGMPVVWTNHSNGRSGSFLGIWLTGKNNGGYFWRRQSFIVYPRRKNKGLVAFSDICFIWTFWLLFLIGE